MNDIIKLSEYRDWLRDLKQQIKTGQIKAALSVNSQMIMLYWDLGRQITEKQENAKWGSSFIEQLSKDLREEFPEMAGFSQTNLLRMKLFYQFYSPVMQCSEVVPQPVGQFNDKIEEQIWAQIVPKLQHIENESIVNVAQVVPKLVLIPWGHHIKIMQKVKDIHQALFYINKTIENKLFYHTKLKCYVIIELKTKKFEPEFIGKLNFYITTINELIKDAHDKPTIGILLCKNKNNYKYEKTNPFF